MLPEESKDTQLKEEENRLEVPQVRTGRQSSDYSSMGQSDLQGSSILDSLSCSDFLSSSHTEYMSEMNFDIEEPFPGTAYREDAYGTIQEDETRKLLRSNSIQGPFQKLGSYDYGAVNAPGTNAHLGQPVKLNELGRGDTLINILRSDTKDQNYTRTSTKEFFSALEELSTSLKDDRVTKESLNLDLKSESDSQSADKTAHKTESSATGKRAPDEEEAKCESKVPKIKIKRIPTLEEHKEGRKKQASKSKKSNSDTSSTRKRRRYKQDSKNIVKNYGKAMAAFSLTETASPYLDAALAQNGATFEQFKQFILKHKEQIDSIESLRQMMLPEEDDEAEVAGVKRAFQVICEVFARDFALNWIFNSKSNQKETLLRYRFKILRRVQKPECFYYLKSRDDPQQKRN